ncbi:alkaline phosphatase family protein [Paenibacillus lignilyticus]|uniref:Alkaline phosphatase family protein n=1 Tax=Paenibacillus lignilyticus TaxID=1172615 RepID=A0ABS5CM61_9BACL|nr:alkaline phosphatase family protein [Paenibacillus lignilyticus]MBP3966958.1 alkaline phosphatase family protein [Paenibacillus lignilyticus]
MGVIKRVVIIGWDGAGNFVQAASTPHLDRLISRGAVSFDAQTASPTISAECWGALMHGVNPDKHGLTNSKAEKQLFPGDSPYPSIFRIAREADPSVKLASFSAWQPINYGIIEPNIGVHKVSMPDREIALATADYISNHSDFKLLYVHLDLPDIAGHKHGYNTPEQLRSIEETDTNTGVILDALEQANALNDSLVIVVSDHGGGGEVDTDHGSDHPLDKTIFWAAAGPGIAPGTTITEPIVITDTAAVVAHALGLAAPESWEAKLPQHLFGTAKVE